MSLIKSGEINSTEKKVVYATLAVVALFIFSILYAREKFQADVPECIPFNEAYLKPGVQKIDANTYQVFAVASMWRFEPSNISVPAGSEVDFYLSSKDVVHGFNIPEKNVNMMAVYGNINKTTVRFTHPGIYKITCHEYCGVGHQFMQGEVTVTAAKH